MNNELLEPVSFSLDLLNLDRKLACNDSSADDKASNSVYIVEQALRAKGIRTPLDQKAK